MRSKGRRWQRYTTSSVVVVTGIIEAALIGVAAKNHQMNTTKPLKERIKTWSRRQLCVSDFPRHLRVRTPEIDGPALVVRGKRTAEAQTTKEGNSNR
mmetsp:Transcript_52986/g.113157  ORF Transcript_52986/g.113157 Transcript_52986/m.113157 type:complete len:97 (+) Transcript_52986:56-346(+)